MSSDLLVVNNLSVRFGGVVALSAVEYKLKPLELCCIIGPNGAGKSTFFKCLTGQLVPTTGDVFFANESIVRKSPHRIARRSVGIKTQVPNVFEGLSVEENIFLSLRRTYSGEGLAERFDEVIRTIGITTRLHERMDNLSHGERQLIELAMVVGPKPSLILLDEPAAGLSKTESTHLAKVIQGLSSSSAIIVVEHDMEFIQMIGNRIVVFNRGEILMDDRPSVVLNDETVKSVYLGKDRV